MSDEAYTRLPDSFDGVVRLFPLPNLVMFPRMVQPLHIFEPRYCDMLEDALSTDKLIAMALLKTGWEEEYEGRPPVERVICIGRVIAHTRLPENRHNLLLLGLERARIEYELPAGAAFRRARVTLLHDELNSTLASERVETRNRLVSLFRELMPPSAQAREQLEQLLAQNLDLGMLTDLVSFTLTLDLELRQSLLAETNVDRRARRLVDTLAAAAARPESVLPRGQIEFPPPFSTN
jgi:uncharacterized protein